MPTGPQWIYKTMVGDHNVATSTSDSSAVSVTGTNSAGKTEIGSYDVTFTNRSTTAGETILIKVNGGSAYLALAPGASYNTAQGGGRSILVGSFIHKSTTGTPTLAWVAWLR